ncbi:MAG: VOC family protein [Rhizomicrobium sp.]|jgi:catechol 2,3-dioxygenase-like lactoylglutathione lyase family enzyme
MAKLSHMVLPVTDVGKSRDWYVNNLDFKLEFEREGVTAVKDTADLTIFLQKATKPLTGEKVTLTIQVKDVDRKHQELASRGVKFASPPTRLFWGYGAEVLDPDGYMNHLWDEVTMLKASREKS